MSFSAQILFQELHASRGYRGGYDTVRNAVWPMRTEATVAALTQRRFETEPGQQAQVDWGQVRTRFDSESAEVHIFIMTLGYLRRCWAESYQNERLGALVAAHEHAFAHFGGCTAEILYDRMRTVNLGHDRGQATLEFRHLEDFNAQLAAWLVEIADLRIEGTTHERAIDRFAGKAAVLAQAATQSRASWRRSAASASWPRTDSSRSTPTATRCPGA